MKVVLPISLLVAALMLWPAMRAVTALDAARAARTTAAADLAGGTVPPVAAPAASFPADDARDARRRLARRLRGVATQGGVLIEAMANDPSAPPTLAALRFSVSGPEKAVLAFADTLERDANPVRFRSWRLIPTPGGVRLDAQAVAPWRG